MGTPSQTSINRPRRTARACVLAACAGAALMAPGAFAQQPRTSDEASSSSLGAAVMAPLRDVNVVRDTVPEVLNGARDAPYLDPQNASCSQLADMLEPLDDALGPDTGEGATAQKAGAGQMVYGAVADVTRDAIPFRGVVRRLTGAARADQKVKDAREAGHLRRAYLKGFASAKGCDDPPDQQPSQQTAQVDAVAVPPPVAVDSQPIAVAAQAPPPAIVAEPQPRLTPVNQAQAPSGVQFNLPESWRAELAAGKY